MDEATKILIGTISGFLIAFLAEPIKIHFQNQAKSRNLRIAIYKEIFFNYSLIKWHFENDSIHNYTEEGKYLLQTECYKYAINQELSLFYQLNEAISVNAIYGYYMALSDVMNDQSLSNESKIGEIKNLMKSAIQEYEYLFGTNGVYKKFMNRLIYKLIAYKLKK